MTRCAVAIVAVLHPATCEFGFCFDCDVDCCCLYCDCSHYRYYCWQFPNCYWASVKRSDDAAAGAFADDGDCCYCCCSYCFVPGATAEVYGPVVRVAQWTPSSVFVTFSSVPKYVECSHVVDPYWDDSRRNRANWSIHKSEELQETCWRRDRGDQAEHESM